LTKYKAIDMEKKKKDNMGVFECLEYSEKRIQVYLSVFECLELI
jgi:hypothetical protein